MSRLYEFDAPGTVQTSFEYVERDPFRMDAPGGSDTPSPAVLSAPVFVDQEVMATVSDLSPYAAHDQMDASILTRKPRRVARLFVPDSTFALLDVYTNQS